MILEVISKGFKEAADIGPLGCCSWVSGSYR